MKGTLLVSVLLVSVLLFACKRKAEIDYSLSPDYKHYNLERMGWKSRTASHHLSEIEYTATWVPIQYYIIKTLGNEHLPAVDSIYQSHKDERVIEVEFKHDSRDDLLKSKYTHRDYETAVKYMSFSLEKDFVAVTRQGDTINCSGITFERNFNLASFKRVLLHFGDIPEDEEIQLVYHDRLFNNGILKFKFTEIPIKL
nr:hypothetical protein [Allomuricauda sp.]